MANEQIKQFGDLDYIPVGDIEDAKNKIPTSWKWLTPNQKDVGITPSQLQQITVLNCDSPAASDKTGTYKDGLDLSGTPEQCTGRSILVHFVNANEKEDVSFTYKNCTGLIKSFNEKTTPVHDSINADSWCLLTWNGTEWLMQPKADFRKINEVIAVINSKIPAAASAENQLTDKKYVDDSIATNSAHFLGTYDSVDKIKVIKNPTNNDYAHYEYTDSDGTKFFDRYKYSDVADSEGNHWKKEFTFESTDFNQAQMNAINSGADKNFVDHAKEITPSEASAENKLADKKFVNDAGIALQENIDKKVDKQEGKGLSTNDFTDELKANVEDNTSKAHTHDNKDILDNLEQDEDGNLKFGETIVGKVQGVKGDTETEYRTGEVNITKDNIGLGSVDNTSDADKPVSTATQTELDKKADKENPVMTGSFSLNRGKGSSVGAYSFTEGYNTTASGAYSHAEGNNTKASGLISHAEGSATTASGDHSHAEGKSTTASGTASHAQGKFNVSTGNKFADVIGNGSSISQRHNASATDWDGNQYLAGDLYVRGTNDDATGGEKVATVTEVGTVQTAVDTLNGNDTVEGSVDYKITEALRGITTFDFKIVSVLPEEGKKGIIYLVRNTSTDEEDRYDEYIWIETETEKYYEMLGSKVVKVDLTEYQKVDGSNATAAGVSAAINKLSTGSSDPEDNDYFISQYVNGGTTTTTYHRRPMSKLWNYIKGKADSVYAAKSHTHTKSQITDFPTSLPANGGTSQYANVLNAWSKTRQTVGNITPASSAEYGTMKMHLVTSSMTDTGRPSKDGYVLTFFWDSIGRYDSQIYIPDLSGNLKARFFENSAWTDWKAIAFTSDIPSISGKADKTATVSTVAYDSTNKKLTKTINGTTSDIVTVATLKTAMSLAKADVGLGNVGNFKAVSTVASQGLTDTEKSNARANIGAGTSNLAIGTTATTAAAGNHTHSYLPLSGGTMTGNINIPDGKYIQEATSGSGYTMLGCNGTIQYVSTPRMQSYLRSSGNDLYHYRGDKSTQYLVLDAANYNDYAPSKTGTGASGTWSISVSGSSTSCTGNAATATTATNLKVSNHDTNNTVYYPVWANGIGNGSTARGTYTSTDLNYIPATGEFKSKKFTVDKNVSLQWNSTTKSLDFVFA